MSEIDERRINDLAQLPSPLLRGGAGVAARAEARKVLEWQAGMRRGEPGEGEEGGAC